MLKTLRGEPISLSDLTYLFLFCPNNSGTTVLSQYLASQIDGYLPPYGNNEGQMVPAVRKMMREKPWNASIDYDWAFIRAAWDEMRDGRIFVEGSPPNLLRFDSIREVFGQDSSAVISICDPYQHIASCMKRYDRHPGDL